MNFNKLIALMRLWEIKLNRVFLFQIYANTAITIYNIISRLEQKTFFIVNKLWLGDQEY